MTFCLLQGASRGGVGALSILRTQLGKDHPEAIVALLTVAGALLLSGDALGAIRSILEVVQSAASPHKTLQGQASVFNPQRSGGAGAAAELQSGGAPTIGGLGGRAESIFPHGRASLAAMTAAGFTTTGMTLAGPTGNSVLLSRITSESDIMGQVSIRNPKSMSRAGQRRRLNELDTKLLPFAYKHQDCPREVSF